MARHHLLEILEDRYGRRSMLVTSQLSIARWFDLIGDPTYANAILDRLAHNADRLELSGESMHTNLFTQAACPAKNIHVNNAITIWLHPTAFTSEWWPGSSE